MTNKLFISTSCYNGTQKLFDIIKIFLEHKIFNIELSGKHDFLEYSKIKKIIKNEKAKFLLHNYFPVPEKPIVLNLISKNKKNTIGTKKIIYNAMKLANETDIDVYGFHPGYLSETKIKANGHFEFSKKKNYSSNQGLKEFKKIFENFYKKKIKSLNKKTWIGLENLFPEPTGQINSIFCDFEEIDYILGQKFINENKVFFLLDLGHLGISANLLKFDRFKFLEKILKKYSHKIIEIHISENDDIFDSHSRISRTSWQLDAVKFLKKKIKNKVYFTYESRELNIEEIIEDKIFLEKII